MTESRMADQTKEQQTSAANGKAKRKPKLTREERRRRREQSYRPVRIIPIWLRLILLVVLLAVALVVGAIVGYSVVGGGNIGDVFHKETWQHPFDVVYSGDGK